MSEVRASVFFESGTGGVLKDVSGKIELEEIDNPNSKYLPIEAGGTFFLIPDHRVVMISIKKEDNS